MQGVLAPNAMQTSRHAQVLRNDEGRAAALPTGRRARFEAVLTALPEPPADSPRTGWFFRSVQDGERPLAQAVADSVEAAFVCYKGEAAGGKVSAQQTLADDVEVDFDSAEFGARLAETRALVCGGRSLLKETMRPPLQLLAEALELCSKTQ